MPETYGESREAYLKMAGEKWPPEVDIFWTGSRVNNTILATPAHLDWETKLIRRKPFLYQNDKYIRGCYRYHYGAEPLTALAAPYWDGFFERDRLVRGQQPDAAQVHRERDRRGFRLEPRTTPERAVREAVGKLVGPGAWEPLRRFTEGLQYFERFHFPGDLKEPPGPEGRRRAARRFPDMEARLRQAESGLRELLEKHPAAVIYWTDSGRYLNAQRLFVAEIQADSNLRLYREATEQERLARIELGRPATNDTFLAPCDFEGGVLAEIPDALDGPPVPACVLHDIGGFTAATATFSATSLPPSSGNCCSAAVGPAPCRVTVELNEKVLADGTNVFRGSAWDVRRFALPADSLKSDGTRNVLRIRSTPLVEKAWRTPPRALMSEGKADDMRMAIRYGLVAPLAAGNGEKAR